MKSIFSLLKQTFTEWREDKAPMLAAALAYYSAFSIAPLLVVILAIVGFVIDQQDARDQIIAQVTQTVGADAAGIVDRLIQNTTKPNQGVLSSILGGGALLFGALGLFTQLQASLDWIWGIEDVKRESAVRGFIKDKLLSFGMILVIGFLLLISLVLSTVLSFFDSFLQGLFPGANVVLPILTEAVSFGVITLLFMFIYKYLPHAEIRWRDVWVGAAVTALLFTIGKTLLGLYLSNSATTSAYGAAGAFVLILLWIYYSAQILLFGAEFTQVYARQHGQAIVAEGADERPEGRVASESY